MFVGRRDARRRLENSNWWFPLPVISTLRELRGKRVLAVTCQLGYNSTLINYKHYQRKNLMCSNKLFEKKLLPLLVLRIWILDLFLT